MKHSASAARRRIPFLLVIVRHLLLGSGRLFRLAVLHRGKEGHDLILVHDHRTDGVDDFKVFQLGFLVVKLLELPLQVLDLLLGFGYFRATFAGLAAPATN